jgi:hypothetical protein
MKNREMRNRENAEVPGTLSRFTFDDCRLPIADCRFTIGQCHPLFPFLEQYIQNNVHETNDSMPVIGAGNCTIATSSL